MRNCRSRFSNVLFILELGLIRFQKFHFQEIQEKKFPEFPESEIP